MIVKKFVSNAKLKNHSFNLSTIFESFINYWKVNNNRMNKIYNLNKAHEEIVIKNTENRK